MRIGIVGAGAQGCFFGALLANAGNQVTFIARGQALNALRTNGLRVKSQSLGEIALPVSATDRPDEVGPVDLIMFCVKTYDLEPAAKQMLPLVGRDTAILPIQNGVEAADNIGSIVGMEHVLGGVSWVGAMAEKPGVIVHGGSTRLVFGELNGGISSRAERICKTLTEAKIAAELHTNIRQALWEKLVVNSAAAGILSLTRLPAGPVLDCSDTMQLLIDTIRESAEVAKACGFPPPERFLDDAKKLLEGYPRWTRPSMEVDLIAGRRLELEAMVGAIVRLGREKGVATPINSTIYRALKPHVNGTPSM